MAHVKVEGLVSGLDQLFDFADLEVAVVTEVFELAEYFVGAARDLWERGRVGEPTMPLNHLVVAKGLQLIQSSIQSHLVILDANT